MDLGRLPWEKGAESLVSFLCTMKGGIRMPRIGDFADPILPFPLRPMNSRRGVIFVYEIPEERRADILEQLYPFRPLPDLEDLMEDIECGKRFKVKEFMVTREGVGNVLCSPYYLEIGGTVIDWWPIRRARKKKTQSC
jgi:hypothetical protein